MKSIKAVPIVIEWMRGNLRGSVAADGALLKNLSAGAPRWRWTPARGEFVPSAP